jgi:hypothetical protein
MKCTAAGFLAPAFVLTLAASAAAQGRAAGRWDITVQAPQGATAFTLTLTQDSEKVSGQLTSPLGAMPVLGTLSDNNLALTGSLTTQGLPLQFSFNATLADEALSGVAKLGMLGDFPFTGRRAAAGATAAVAESLPATPAPPVAGSPAAPAGSTAAPAPAPAAATGAALDAMGTWNIIVKIAGADFPLTATLKQEETRLTGVINSLAGDVPLNGTMTDGALKIEFIAETPGGPLGITLTGQLGAAGFVGKASVAGLGEVDWTGTRGK